MKPLAFRLHPGRVLRKLAWLAVLLGAVVPASAAAVWTTNYPAAVAQAKKEHKKILLYFTGSDWCSWCIQLNKDVYDTPEFAKYAAMDLVLVTVDFPMKNGLSAKLETQNNALKAKYEVDGFPTTILLDENERALEEIEGYLAGGPKAFIAKLGGHAANAFLKAFKAKFYAHDLTGAIATCTVAIGFDPHNALAYDCRGAAKEEKHDDAGALADFQHALELDPTSPEANDSLAWILAVSPNDSIRNGNKAVEYASAACKLSEWKSPEAMDTLAAAYAETGHFADAIKWEKMSLEITQGKAAIEDARHRLGLYELNFPYHEDAK